MNDKHDRLGRFAKKNKVQYASSDERDDAEETEEFIEKNRDRQIENSKKQAEEQKKEQRIQELDRAISNAEWAISNSRLDTATLKDYEVLLKKLKAERKTLK